MVLAPSRGIPFTIKIENFNVKAMPLQGARTIKPPCGLPVPLDDVSVCRKLKYSFKESI